MKFRVSSFEFRVMTILFMLLIGNIHVKSLEKDSTRYSLLATYNHGVTLFESNQMFYLLNDFAKGAEFGVIRRRYQSDVWEKDFKCLETGMSLWFSTFGRKDILGEGIVLKTFANFQMFQLGKLNARYHLSFGPTYVTKIFDIKHNFHNDSFSTRLNAYSGIGFMLNYSATERIMLTCNYLLHHISNGSFKKPNIGITLMNFGIGAKYEFNSKPLQPPVYHGKTPLKSRELLCTFGLGANQASIYNSQRYISGSLSVAHLWYVNKTKAYGMGVDIIHLGGAPFASMEINDEEINKHNTFSDNLFLGLFATMESHLGSTSPYLTIGYDVYHKTATIQPMYARLGFRQKIAGNLSAHFSIKVRFFFSEFMEFGVAYRLRYKTD